MKNLDFFCYLFSVLYVSWDFKQEATNTNCIFKSNNQEPVVS